MRRLVKLGVLASAPWPFLRAAAYPAVWRAYPRRTAIGAFYVLVYAAVLLALALLEPWLLVPVAVAAAVGTGVRLWFSRAGYGRERRLPPGRLEVLPTGPITNPEHVAELLRRHGPVAKMTVPTLPAPCVCVLGLQRGSSLLAEHRERLGPVGIVFDAVIPSRFLRNMNPDDHREHKKVFHGAFRPEVVAACEPDFARLADEELDRLAAAGAEADPVPFLIRYAVNAGGRLFFGFAPGSSELARAELLYATVGRYIEFDGLDSPEGREVVRVADELATLVRGEAAAIAADGGRGEEPSPSFLAELLRVRPDAAGIPDLVLNHVFLLRTATADMSGLLAWIVHMLGANPGWTERLRDASDPDDLSRRIVLETLRLQQSEFIQRKVLEPIELGGYVVPAGWFLRICVHESHRDPDVFERPDDFDPDRFLGRSYSRYEFLPFGTQEHACIGAVTTLAVCSAFVRALAERDWAVVRDGRPEFLRFHWQPSRHLRLRVAPARAPAALEPQPVFAQG